jgi:hypothetical protein
MDGKLLILPDFGSRRGAVLVLADYQKPTSPETDFSAGLLDFLGLTASSQRQESAVHSIKGRPVLRN